MRKGRTTLNSGNCCRMKSELFWQNWHYPAKCVWIGPFLYITTSQGTKEAGEERRIFLLVFNLLKVRLLEFYFNEKYIPFELGGPSRWYHLLLMTQQWRGRSSSQASSMQNSDASGNPLCWNPQNSSTLQIKIFLTLSP